MVPPPLNLKPNKESRGYQLVNGQDHNDEEDDAPSQSPVSPERHLPHRAVHNRTLTTILIALIACLLIFVAVNLAFNQNLIDALRGLNSDYCPKPTRVPQYFQTSPELWAGPTATGKPAFMAQTRTFDPTATFVPNQPLQTAIPVEGMGSENTSIFQMMGYLSPYLPSPGFGVDEYPLPPGADLVQVQMLSRHGSRYPTTGANVGRLGKRLADAKGVFKASGRLEFLNDWSYELGAEILVPKGRQELFDSGILHSYMYGSLYNPNSKIIVRTTTQDRMLKSAEYFMAGFFGLEWTRNATIEVIIEEAYFNNSLAGYMNCPNGLKDQAGTNATIEWVTNYLQKGERLSVPPDTSCRY